MKKLNFLLLCLSSSLIAMDGETSSNLFYSGLPISAGQAPAIVSFSLRNEDSWRFSFNAKFDEYQALADSLEIAFPSSFSNGFGSLLRVPVGEIVTLDNDYHPGFQIGFVLNTPYDTWDFGGEYLWYRGTSHAKAKGNSDIFYSSPIFVGPFNLLIGSLEADWKLGIDLIDFYLSRPYFSGNSLSFTPTLGLRGGWIRQHFNVTAANFLASSNLTTADTNSRVWLIGPKTGLQTNYIVGYGFSIFGNLATSFLYTQYNALSLTLENHLDQVSYAKNNGLSTFRSILDAGVGLNWGSKGAVKVNFNAAYNLSVFFSQNMERTLVSIAGGQQGTPGNLYLSGLTIGASVEF